MRFTRAAHLSLHDCRNSIRFDEPIDSIHRHPNISADPDHRNFPLCDPNPDSLRPDPEVFCRLIDR